MNIGILGAGIAGLYCASKLINAGHKVTIYEKESFVGGLARSHNMGSYSYDVGPHIVFSKDKETLKEMLLIHKDWNEFERKNQIILNGIKIDYPFENYLGMLDSETLRFCLDNFIKNSFSSIEAKNMKDFFLKTFGIGIYETYLEPYNKKLWKRDLTELDLQMVERIPKPPAEHVTEGAKRNYFKGYTHQATFHYPKIGGIQSFVNSLYCLVKNSIEIKLNSEVVGIHKKSDKFQIYINEEEKAFTHDVLINTIPLKDFIQLSLSIESISSLQDQINKLEYIGLCYGIIEVKSVTDKNVFAFTVPDTDIIFHRISYLNNINGLNNAEFEERHIFLFEFTYIDEINLDQLKYKVAKKILEGMMKCNLTEEESYINFDIKKVDKAYVVYNFEHRLTVDKVLDAMNHEQIITVGRFGLHEYLNMDQVIISCKKNLENLF